MSLEEYRRLTYDLTLAVARQILPGNPGIVFECISGEGTDVSSRQTWARIKAAIEAALFNLGFREPPARVQDLSTRCVAPRAECRHCVGSTL